MSYWCHFYLIILMLMMIMESVESHVTDASFDMVESGQSIMGKIASEHHARRSIECSSM